MVTVPTQILFPHARQTKWAEDLHITAENKVATEASRLTALDPLLPSKLQLKLMDGETDAQSDAQLEAMGFASFGQKHKRPKHHHGSGPLELAQDNLPKKPLASVHSPVEVGRTPVANQARRFGLSKSQVSLFDF